VRGVPNDRRSAAARAQLGGRASPVSPPPPSGWEGAGGCGGSRMTGAGAAYRDYYEEAPEPAFHQPRYRWTVETFLADAAGKAVLEIGCGDGGCIDLLRETSRVAGVDASETGVARCRARGLPVVLADVSTDRLPFEPDSFDAVVCLETLEHLANPQHALDEITRVLRPGGRLVCSIPNPRIGHPYLYPGLFTFENFRRFLEQNGFVIERVAPWGWAPRESVLPAGLRGNRLARSRYVAGVLRRALHLALHRTPWFPHYLYWLWTFAATHAKDPARPGAVEAQARATRPRRAGAPAGGL
jgi:SAM-dependent methyltransferase